jgi:type I restriction enzyme S subunit
MNAERLLAHYEQIADAPDAIARLRRFILDLAVRGKLVPQDPKDEPAAELLKRIAKEKALLVAEGRFNSLEPTDYKSTTPEPFAVPSTWVWCLLDDIAGIARGGSPRPIKSFLTDDANGIPWIKIGDSTRGSIYINSTSERIKPEGLSRSRLVVAGDLLLSNSMSFGYPYITNISGCIHDGWLVIRTPKNQICKLYIHSMFLSEYAKQAFSRAAAGAVVQNLNADKVRRLPVPLPPLAEQHRIVSKVDELMALCDRLDATRENREAVRDQLAAASLARLNAPDPETFQADVQFGLGVLAALATRPDQIKHLRQTIFNLAVRGKLTPQDANDEPASELLKRIGPQIDDRNLDLDHDLPTSWAWALIEECFAVSGGMQKTPARTPKANAFPYLGVGNVYRGRLDLASVKKFELAAGELERFRLEPGDILVVEGNGSASEIGRCAVWHGQIENCVHQNHLIRCRPKELQLTPYAALYLNSPDGMAEMKRLAITSAGLFSLSVGKIRKIPFPLPPLAEQHRIVAKVDELMALCDRLETSLTTIATTRRRLLDALLAEALVIDALAVTQDCKMEAAE